MAKFLINKKFNVVIIIIAILYLILLSGFRNENFSVDIEGYLQKYFYLKYNSITSLLLDIFNPESKDPFFYFFSKFFSLAGVTGQQYLALLSSIYLFSFAVVVKKLSPDPAFSFIYLISNGFLLFSYGALRQSLAMSILMISIILLIQQKYYKFLICVLIACLFHSSAIIFIICPLLMKSFFKKYGIYIITMLIGIVYLFPDITRLFVFSLNIERLNIYEENYKVLNSSGFVIYLFMFCFSYYYNKSNDYVNNLLLSLVLFGLSMQALSIVIAEFFRIAMYFNICYAFLLPRIMLQISLKQIRYIWITSIYGSLIFYFLYSQIFSKFELINTY